jgi:lactoylglutathione lyase
MRKLSIYLIITAIVLMGTTNSSAQNTTKPHLNHIAVFVHNLQVSSAFYSEIIGLEIIPEPFKDGRHTWFTLGNAGQLHLISGAKENLEHYKNSHLCFSVSSIEDFIARLDRHKIAYTNWKGDSKSPTIRPDGVKQIYFQDPDGYWLEVNNDHQ